jgi:hypothetical protein
MSDKPYELGKYPPVNQLQFLVSRAEAVQAYAQLETALAILFSMLLGAPINLAGLVFLRITNTFSRNRILSDLMTQRHGTTFKVFWDSALSFVRTLDQRRNEIVHWHVVNNINLGPDTPHELASTLALNPPTGWLTNSAAKLSEVELQDFILQCDYVSRAINMFALFISGKLSEPGLPWRDVFQQPIEYPPPDTHPLSRNYKAPGPIDLKIDETGA